MERTDSLRSSSLNISTKMTQRLIFLGIGAFVLCFFSVIQKGMIGEFGLIFAPRAYIMPILYGGATGLILGEWYIRLRQNALQIELSEERLRALINALPDFVIFKDGEARWQDVNKAGRELFGFPTDEYRNRTDLELVSLKPLLGDLLRYCHITDLEAWKRGETIHCQVSSLPYRGKLREFDLVKVPLFWQDGQRKGMVIVGRDITEIRESEHSIMQAYDSTLEGWAMAVEMRDKTTEDHTRRVTALTENLSRLLGVSDSDLVHIRRGALLHDIGKIGIPDAILNKPGTLTSDEMQVMKQHPEQARQMLEQIEFLRPALDIPYCHHERWDGSGYPRGLHGEQIPLAARIFAVVDVWDALTSDRPYRRAWTAAEALAYIERACGQQFDPSITQVFLRNHAQVCQPVL